MTTVGTGKHTYTLTSDWAKMPDAHPLGAVSALASDSAGDIYAFHRADPPIAIFDRATGDFKSGWGNGGYVYAHGFYIEEDKVYLTDRDTSTCMMYTLDGKLIQMLGRYMVHSDTGAEVAGQLVPRAAGPFNYPRRAGAVAQRRPVRRRRLPQRARPPLRQRRQPQVFLGQARQGTSLRVPPAPQPAGDPR